MAIANRCNIDIAKTLLASAKFTIDAVNSVDVLGQTALHIATEQGDLAGALLLQQSRKFTSFATICHHKGTALQIALERGHQELIELLQM